MEQFYQLDPVRMGRYEPYMTEWLKTYREDMSEMGWTAGLYVQRAIGTVTPKGAPYPDSPLTLYEKPQRHEEDADEVYEFTDADRFGAFATMFNKMNGFTEKPQDEEAGASAVSEEAGSDDLSADGAPDR